jgi:hypothetical protein
MRPKGLVKDSKMNFKDWYIGLKDMTNIRPKNKTKK